MRRFSRAAACAALSGSTMMMLACGAAAPTPTPSHAPLSALVSETLEPTSGAIEVPTLDALATVDLTGLPAAPWSAEPLPSSAVPAQFLSAWASAPNRGQCEPLSPARLGAAEGAQARVSRGLVEGGWAVEFDRRGMPGMTADGEECARCGRGVFGIAGTSMTPEELVTEDDELDVPTPSFADGSHVQVEPAAEGESVAAAMFTVRGQGCVYQVWSFLGEDHVRELVDGLRRVEVRQDPVVAAR